MNFFEVKIEIVTPYPNHSMCKWIEEGLGERFPTECLITKRRIYPFRKVKKNNLHFEPISN